MMGDDLVRLIVLMTGRPSDMGFGDASEARAPRVQGPGRRMIESNHPLDRDDKPLVLIIDDDDDMVRLLVRFLQSAGYRTMYAEDGVTGLNIAEKYAPHLILLDLNLPKRSGFELCEEIKSRLRLADTPVIFITGMDKTDDLIRRCFDAGAHDLIHKPVREVDLIARVRVALREQALRESYRHLAIEDPYTGLSNRRYFILNIMEAILISQRSGTESILIMADIDDLASYNKQFGHDLGDEAILTLARLIKRFRSPACRIGRMGGEEMALVMTHTSKTAAWALCDRIRKTFSAIAFDAKTCPKHFSASFGMASYSGDPPNFDVDQFLLKTDIALCAAKKLGRGRMAGYWQLDPQALPVISPDKQHARSKVRKRGQRAFVAAPTEPSSEAMPVTTPTE